MEATEQKQNFEGWALVELFGHGREIGFVTTRYFGQASLFQIDVPALPERESQLRSPQYIDGLFTPAGATVKRSAVPGRSRLVGIAAVYSIQPCSEEAALETLERVSERELKLVQMPESPRLPAASLPEVEDVEFEELGEEEN